MLAPDCDEHGAYMLAERIRAAVHEALVRAATRRRSRSASASPPSRCTASRPTALLRTADQALYAAKRLGRNRSVISSAEVPGILARAPRRDDGDAHVELGALLNLAEALDVRDRGSASHCRRVGRFAELTARELGLPPDAVERVRLAGHPPRRRAGRPARRAARKHGPLTDEEWVLVRAHPAVGARMVETTEYEDIRSWILFHHERPDGHGYPEGRGESEVPLEASIIAVADAYEAMTSERPVPSPRSPRGGRARSCAARRDGSSARTSSRRF